MTSDETATIALIHASIAVRIERGRDQNPTSRMVLVDPMCGLLRGTAGPDPSGPDPLATA